MADIEEIKNKILVAISAAEVFASLDAPIVLAGMKASRAPRERLRDRLSRRATWLRRRHHPSCRADAAESGWKQTLDRLHRHRVG